MPDPKLVALSLGGIALTAATAVVTASNHTPEAAALPATGRALMVGIPFAVGLYAWRRGLGVRFGPLLMVMAVVASLTTLAESGNDVVYSSGRVAGWVFEVGLIYLMLSFPTGRITARVDRWLVGIAAGVAALLFLPTAALVEFYPEPSPYGTCHGDCPPNAFALLGAEPGVVDSLVRPVREIVTALLFVAVALRLTQRLRRASPPMRRTLTPVLVVAAIRCGTFAIAFPIRATSPESALLEGLFWIFALALPLIAVAFLAGELHSRLFVASALERLGTLIGATPSSGTLRSALAETLGDESLEVATWEPARGAWVDSDGSTVLLPGPGSGRCTTEVRYDRRCVALLIHDEALGEDPGFVEAVGAYALVAFENRRLIARVAASTREVHDSRSRILATANEERRRIERDLHDGAQQQLVALRIHLELIEEMLDSDPARARAKLHALGYDVEDTLDSIRSLAHGVYPALLEDRGLAEALRSATRGMPIQASVKPDGSGRYTPEVETAVYFCCLEAVQNAAKHATGVHHITISLTQGKGLDFEVRDDGDGFDTAVSPSGSGLVNMRDRVAALGGELTVTSAPGEGTTVTGSLPVRALG